MSSFSAKFMVLCLCAGLFVLSASVTAVDIPTDESAGTWNPDTRVYTLASDLDLTDENLNIVEDNLTLDGNGWTITGIGIDDWYGVLVSGRSHVAIKNLTAEGFDRGIEICRGSSYVTVTNCTVSNNNVGIDARESNYITLTGNTASHNSSCSWSCGISFWMCKNNVVSNNIASDNTNGIDINAGCVTNQLTGNRVLSNLSEGIGLAACTDSTLTGNYASGNGCNPRGDGPSPAIQVFAGSVNTTLTGNTAEGNAGDGIAVRMATGNILRNNTSSKNGGYGIVVGGCQNNELTANTCNGNVQGITGGNLYDTLIQGNTASHNVGHDDPDPASKITGEGIVFYSCYHNTTIINNTCEGNAGIGISLGSANWPDDWSEPVTDDSRDYDIDTGLTDGALYRNIISGNTVSDNAHCGIGLWRCRNNTLENNRASGSGWCGIDLNASRFNTLTNNQASFNTESGIWLVNFCRDNTVTANTASDNTEDGIAVGCDCANTKLTGNTAAHNKGDGISLDDCANNTVTGNTCSANGDCGVGLGGTHDTTLTGNTLSNNATGIWLGECTNAGVYNNSFLSNRTQASVWGGSGNFFNLDKPIGGNFWNDWTGPDRDHDGFVDNPYVFAGGQDNLPWAGQNSWLLGDLLAKVRSLKLAKGIENSLLVKLGNAQQKLDAGNTGAALNGLQAFINEVEAQRGKAISVADANALIAAARNIISVLSGM